MGAISPFATPALEAVSQRLDALMQRARHLKPVGTVEPPLPIADFSDENGIPLDITGLPIGAHNSVVETAARRLYQAKAASTDINSPAFVDVWNLFDILNICGDQGQCETSLVWLLIEEMLDAQSIEGCKVAFDYLDSRRERLTSKNFKSKNLIILRTCNELLRRLSRAEDTVFCGRVYIFLFQSFPLGDKSSVNLRGEFHTENVTTFEAVDLLNGAQEETGPADESTTNEVAMVDAATAGSGDAVTITVSEDRGDGKPEGAGKAEMSIDELYPVFWTLQKAFSNPPTVFEAQFLSSFRSGLEATLTTFQRVPRVIQAAAIQEQRGLKRKAGEHDDGFAASFNPKYLTSRELFELELSDLAFQRHIMVQALILLDFLLSLTEKSKSRLAHLTTQKSLQYPFTLSEDDAQWAKKIREVIRDHLQAGESGKFYYRMVETVLSRDKNWVRWKMESCPPIAKPPVSDGDYLAAKMGARTLCTNKRLRPTPMGSLNLAFLTDADYSSTEGLRGAEKDTQPSAESLYKGIENDGLDLEMAANEEERTQLLEAQQNKTWRLLRLMAKTKLGTFNAVEESNKLDVFFKEPDAPETDQPKDSATIGDEAAEDVANDAEPGVEDAVANGDGTSSAPAQEEAARVDGEVQPEVLPPSS